jgi:purine-binding chemotaxis protein CheW
VNATHVQVRVGREAYAIPVTHIKEVVELGRLSPLPGSGPHVLGLRSLRAQVLPVFDLAELLGAGDSGPPAQVCVAARDGQTVGLAVDEVTDVSSLTDEGEEGEAPLLARSQLVGRRLVGVIDADALFDELDRRGGT